jgi:hypothetical protein
VYLVFTSASRMKFCAVRCCMSQELPLNTNSYRSKH